MSEHERLVLGIDISKRKFDVALLRAGKMRTKVLSNDARGFEALGQWLARQGVDTPLHACMEATSHYGEDLALWLCEHGHRVSMVNPARIRAYAASQLARSRSDALDARLIARFCHGESPEPWQPPSPSVRELQALVRRLDALLDLQGQESNRLEHAHPAVRGSLEHVLDTLEREIRDTRAAIARHIDNDPDLRERARLLDSIRGVGKATLAQVLAELPVERLQGARAAGAFCGLDPARKTSGSSVRGRARISKTGSTRLRKALFMPTLTAMQHNPVIRAFAERLRINGLRGKALVCACMRKLVHIIYGVLKHRRPFNPELALAA